MVQSSAYRESDAVIAAYQGRILFDDAEGCARAEWLASLVQRKFGVAIAPDSFTLPADRFAEIAPFMALNRNGLTLRFHPVMGDGAVDENNVICTYDGRGTAELKENPDRIVSWHFHIYYKLAEIDKARWLRAKIVDKFSVATYQVEERAGGPHPMPNLEIQVSRAEFPKLLPWLALNRQGLSVHVHPRSADFIGDHVVWPLWLGEPVRLIEEELDGMRPPGKEKSLRHFNGAPLEPPSPDTRFPPTA